MAGQADNRILRAEFKARVVVLREKRGCRESTKKDEEYAAGSEPAHHGSIVSGAEGEAPFLTVSTFCLKLSQLKSIRINLVTYLRRNQRIRLQLKCN